MKSKEITLFKIEAKTQYADTVGRLPQKSQVQEQNLATVLLDRDHIAAE